MRCEAEPEGEERAERVREDLIPAHTGAHAIETRMVVMCGLYVDCQSVEAGRVETRVHKSLGTSHEDRVQCIEKRA